MDRYTVLIHVFSETVSETVSETDRVSQKRYSIIHTLYSLQEWRFEVL